MREAMLNRIAGLVCRRPATVVVAALVLAALSALYAALQLRLNADTDDLIAPSRPFMRDYRALLTEFGDLEYVYAVIDEPNPERAHTIVEYLVERLKPVNGLRGVYGSVRPHEQLRLATRAMSEAELEGFVNAADAIAALRSSTDAVEMVRHAQQMLRTLLERGGQMPGHEQQRLGTSGSLLLRLIAAAHPDSPHQQDLAMFLGDLSPHYFTSETGRLHFITIIPVKDYTTLSVLQQPLTEIRAVLDEARRKFPGVEMGLTGKPVLQADEMAISSRDMTIATLIGFSIVSVLFMIVIGGVLRPALAAVAFGCAAAWTYGAATLLVGQLNLLSIVFALVLVGIGFDYGVHILARYNERRRTDNAENSIRAALRTTGAGNLTSAITSSAVFLLAMLTSFQGLRELGLIAGTGLLLCLTSMLVVLPALLMLVDRTRAAPGISGTRMLAAEQTPGVLRWTMNRPGTTVIALALLTIALAFTGGRLRFEENLLELQAEGTESVDWEHRVLEDSPSATWYGAIMADDLDRLQQIIAQAGEFPSTIGRVQSVLDVIAVPTNHREDLRQNLRATAALSDDQPAPEAAPPVEIEALRDAIGEARRAVNSLAAGAALAGTPAGEVATLRQLAAGLETLAGQMNGPRAAEVRDRIAHNLNQARSAMEIIIDGDRLPLREALPDPLRDMMVSRDGKYLAMLFPRQNVWEPGAMRDFIGALRHIDPHATGAPITHYESLQDMKRSFLTMAVAAFFIVAGLVWLDFRSVRDTALVMLPLIVGTVWLLGAMSALDISFNLANFFSVPILLGVGVDGAVHIVHRYREGGPARLHFGSTRRAVILTALTTMIGFGCLMFAHHRGMRSLGLVMALGSLAVLLATLLALPATLALLERWRGPVARSR